MTPFTFFRVLSFRFEFDFSMRLPFFFLEEKFSIAILSFPLHSVTLSSGFRYIRITFSDRCHLFWSTPACLLSRRLSRLTVSHRQVYYVQLFYFCTQLAFLFLRAFLGVQACLAFVVEECTGRSFAYQL